MSNVIPCQPGMTFEQYERAIGMLTAGMSARDFARHFQCQELTISRRDGIIEPVVVPYLQHNVKIFQHDNARPHIARHTQKILCIHNVNVLQWSARSPYLSPIGHLWDHLGRQVRERHDVNNFRDPERALQAEWVRIPLQVIRKLIFQHETSLSGSLWCKWWAH